MAQAPSPRNLAVMVVDDDAAIRRLTRKILQDDGFEVIDCASGLEAQTRLFAEHWDILLLDLDLGDINGRTLCEAVKRDPRQASKFVIIVSADSDPLQKVALLDTGAEDYVTKPFHPAELVARVRAAARLLEMQRRLVTLNETLAHSTTLDGLTQLFNHKYFQEKLAFEYEASLRYARSLAVAMIDVDSFKHVNDKYGHAIGDSVLEQVAKVLLAETRASDIAARYGGDEFALILRETRADAALRCANRIAIATRALRVDVDDGQVRATVSIGLAAIPHRRITSARQLLEYADRALYRAKRNGRNQVQAWGRPTLPRPAEEQIARSATLSVV
jgi:diguanylate cyclase (GGDEF)-like protein